MLKFDIPDEDWGVLQDLGMPDAAYDVEPSRIGWNWDTIVVSDPAWVTWLLLQENQLPWIIERI